MIEAKLKTLGQLLLEETQAGMKAAAERHGLVTGGRIDLRGAKIRFDHSDLDLRFSA